MTAPIRTPDQRLRVFVSSTLQELADERVASKEAIQHLRFPVRGIGGASGIRGAYPLLPGSMPQKRRESCLPAGLD